MKKAIKSYIREVQFGMMFVICITCVILVGIQTGFMFTMQDSRTIWQGICKGGALSDAGDNRTNMVVHCPGEEEFVLNDPILIMTSKDDGKVFYCKRTEGSIMKDEDWLCTVPKGDD